ncbi:hypothetical protein Tco_1124651 [Tanacetum coccineum]|uniref:Uncharacterized protein n=1 Tax=Tanacetum coccineum TaxID=301880 RepID=A0ABQ5J7D8_9ASTR
MIDELKRKFNGMSIEINKKKELQHLEQVANLSTYPSQRFKSFCYDNDDDYDYEASIIPLNEIDSQIHPSIAITPILPTFKPEDSLIMRNEDLSTIPEKESDELIKSSVEDLVPIPGGVIDFPVKTSLVLKAHDAALDDGVLLVKRYQHLPRVQLPPLFAKTATTPFQAENLMHDFVPDLDSMVSLQVSVAVLSSIHGAAASFA